MTKVPAQQPKITWRTWRHVEVTGFCWIWRGRQTRDGYGVSTKALAHRRVYTALVGPIPAGLELDHLCRIPLCVNPDHLEPVTRAENMRRRYAMYVSPARCVNGHEYTPENTYQPPTGYRECRICVRARVTAYQSRTRGALTSGSPR